MHVKEKFKPLIEDLTFKYLFSNTIILSDFINSYFEYINVDKKFYFSSVESQKLITAPNRDLKNYYGDIISPVLSVAIISP